MIKTYVYYISGLHCNACKLMTESELDEVPGVTHAVTDLMNKTVTVTGEFDDRSAEELLPILSVVLEKKGYTLTLEKSVESKKWHEFKIAIPIVVTFVAIYIGLQKMGLINLIPAKEGSYVTPFVVGIVASLSTCMAVVGGLVLSVSATFAKSGSTLKPQIMFHAGRIVAFFVLGGVLGVIGSTFQLSNGMSLALGLILGIVMLILGLNLLDVFDWTKKWQLSMPAGFGKKALKASGINHNLAPILLGVVTFVLPCGFTQSMQLYALTTGSFLSGSLTMLLFALGTLPVLALVSFSSFSFENNPNKGIFFKTAGLIVILFAGFNMINDLASAGIIDPIFAF